MPQRERTLTLAERKIQVRLRIAEHRRQCVAGARGAIVPLEWIDEGLQIWRRIFPLLQVLGPVLRGCAADGEGKPGVVNRLLRTFTLGRKIFILLRGVMSRARGAEDA